MPQILSDRLNIFGVLNLPIIIVSNSMIVRDCPRNLNFNVVSFNFEYNRINTINIRDIIDFCDSNIWTYTISFKRIYVDNSIIFLNSIKITVKLINKDKVKSQCICISNGI